jgi:hypothetical protein
VEFAYAAIEEAEAVILDARLAKIDAENTTAARS